MLVAVSLDLYIIRKMLELGEGVESVAEECKSFIGVIDNWAGVCVFVCMYVYVCVCMYVCMCVYVYVC
jgi:hypothetical protein